MIRPVARSFAFIFALAIAIAPNVAPAQSVAAYPSPGARMVHHHARKAAGEAGLARPIIVQPPRRDLPAISRNPEDCTRTMCTCLKGGGC